MASMSEEVWNWLEDAYRSKLKISDLLTSTFGATLESVQEIFGNELIQQYREKLKVIYKQSLPICCRNKSCDGRIEDGVQCGKCNSCRCAGCLKTFPPETYGAHLDKCPANSASKKPLKAEKNGVHGEGLCPENGNGGKRKCVFRCGNCGILGHTQKSCPELYLLKSKKKARIESKKKRSTLSFEELKEEENSEEESSHEEEEDEDVPPSTEEEDEDEDIVEGTKEEEEKEMDVEAFYHATLSNLNCSKNSFGNSLKMLAKVVPEAQIHANRENLERIYKTYTDSLHSESSRAPSSVSLNGKKKDIPSSLRPPSVNTSLSKKAPANGVIEILTTSSEDTSPLEELPLAVQEVKISLPPHASSTPPIECVVAFGGCGVVNPASHLSCSQCSNLLWSATNRFGDQFYLGQRVTFWRKKTGLSYEGKLVRIYPLVAGVEPEIKFKYLEPYMDDKYDEISGVINVYRDVQQLQQGIGRRERVKSKVLNIEAPAPLIRVKRDPYEIKEGDRFVTCSCGAPNPLQVSTCGKCSALLRTGLNKLGDKFRIGQNIVFLRNKTGVVDDGKIIFIHPVAPGEPEHVTVKYLFEYVADKYDEVVPLNHVFADRESANEGIGKRERIKAQQFNISVQEHSSTYGPLSQQMQENLMEQMARRLAQKEEESSIFGSMKDFKGMKVVDLRDYVFLEDFEDFEESSATTVEEGKKVRCLCNGFYQSNMREKHMLSAERHLIFIAIQFKALELPYICTCGKEVATLNRLTSHFTTSAHRNYVASFNPKVIEIIPPDEDDMLDNVKDEQVLEGVAYNRKLRLNNKFCQVDEIVLYTVLCSIQFCSGLNRNFRLDRYQQKGLAVDLHYSLRTHNSLSKESSTIIITLQEFEELVLFVPLSLSELKLLRYARAILDRGNAAKVIEFIHLFLEGHSIPLEQLTVPEYSIESVVKYKKAVLADPASVATVGRLLMNCKLCTLKELKDMKLSLPLTFYQFEVVMGLAYSIYGGREAVEYSVKGAVAISPSSSNIRAMYGGVCENFIQVLAEYSRMNKNSVFTDVGSGIGQVCIQLAATYGCMCYGIEIIGERHDIGLNLIKAFDAVLTEAGCVGTVSEKIILMKSNFIDKRSIVSNSSIILYNNYGPWFSADNPGKDVDLNTEFSNIIRDMTPGGQIFTFNSLLHSEKWLDKRVFSSGAYASSWTNNKLDVNWYTVVAKKWKCTKCSYENIIDAEACLACCARALNPRNQYTNGNNRCNR